MRPLFLTAGQNGQTLAQWLLFVAIPLRPFLPRAVFAHCGPQVICAYQEDYDSIFEAYFRWIQARVRPGSFTVHNRTLIRGISRSALERCGFDEIDECCPYINRIDKSDEAILADFHASHRANTRKAMREGYSFCTDVGVEEYYALSVETYGRSNKEGPALDHIARIMRHMVPADTAALTGVRQEDRLIAATVVLYHARQGYFLYGASSTEKARGATAYLHYRNMLFLREKGVQTYDVGGAKLDERADAKAVSLTQFKQRFGGEMFTAFGGVWHRDAQKGAARG